MLLLQTFGFDFGSIAGFFQSLLLNAIQFITNLFIFLWNLIVNIFVLLVNGILSLFGIQIQGNRLNYAFGLRIWPDFLKRFWFWLVEKYRALLLWLKTHLEPIIRVLRRIRLWLDEFWRKYVRPVLNLISRIRRTLTIFRIFNVKWAKALDNKLARIQGKISEAFNRVRSELNSIINLLNLTLDPAGLIRSTVLGGSIARALADLWEAITGTDLQSAIGQLPTTQGEATRISDPKLVAEEFRQAMEFNSGAIYDLSQDAADWLTGELQR